MENLLLDQIKKILLHCYVIIIPEEVLAVLYHCLILNNFLVILFVRLIVHKMQVLDERKYIIKFCTVCTEVSLQCFAFVGICRVRYCLSAII